MPPLAIVEKKAGKVGFYTEEGRRLGEVQVAPIVAEPYYLDPA